MSAFSAKPSGLGEPRINGFSVLRGLLCEQGHSIALDLYEPVRYEAVK